MAITMIPSCPLGSGCPRMLTTERRVDASGRSVLTLRGVDCATPGLLVRREEVGHAPALLLTTSAPVSSGRRQAAAVSSSDEQRHSVATAVAQMTLVGM